jgi:hypothetical protein
MQLGTVVLTREANGVRTQDLSDTNEMTPIVITGGRVIMVAQEQERRRANVSRISGKR